MSNDELEPTAYLFDHTGDDDAQIVRIADKGGGSKYWTAKEPLVRVSAVLDELERAKMAAQERTESADELLRRKLKSLRDNDQNSGDENGEE